MTLSINDNNILNINMLENQKLIIRKQKNFIESSVKITHVNR